MMEFTSAVQAKKFLEEKGWNVDITSDEAKRHFYYQAASHEDRIDELKAYLVLGMNIDTEYDGTYPIHGAAGEEYQLKKLQFLIDCGADLEIRDEWGETPIFSAVGTCKMEPVNLLLKAGVEIDATNNDGQNILHKAVKCGALEALKYFFDQGVDPEVVDKFDKRPIDLVKGNGSYALEKRKILAGEY